MSGWCRLVQRRRGCDETNEALGGTAHDDEQWETNARDNGMMIVNEKSVLANQMKMMALGNGWCSNGWYSNGLCIVRCVLCGVDGEREILGSRREMGVLLTPNISARASLAL